MIRMRLIDCDNSKMTEISLKGDLPDVVFGRFERSRDDCKYDKYFDPPELYNISAGPVTNIIVDGITYGWIVDPATNVGRPIYQFEASSAEELMLRLHSGGFIDEVPDSDSGRGRNASARLIKMKGEKDALATENKKLKDKIAKMREMLK